MKQYQDLLGKILDQGTVKTDRTGTGTLSIFGPQMRFDLREGFPLVTTKKMHLKGIIAELLWLLSGSTNIKPLVDQNVHIWDEWPYARYVKESQQEPGKPQLKPMGQAEFVAAIKDSPRFAQQWGDLGPVYGAAWRRWPNYVPRADGTIVNEPIDQIAEVLRLLRTQPDSRRILVNAWDVAGLPKMLLSPCHCLFQFYTVPLNEYDRGQWARVHNPTLYAQLQDVRMSRQEATMDAAGVPTFRLDCQLYQRSADVFLGVPYNIASYALLTMMVAQVVNMVPGEFIWTGGDSHLYSNHREQAKTQLSRIPYPLPQMKLNPEVKDLFAFTLADFDLEGYECHPAIKAPVAV